MDEAIKAFEAAYKAMVEAERKLDPYVAEAIKSTSTIEGLNDLIDRLPRTYKGSRRVYEAIIRLES